MQGPTAPAITASVEHHFNAFVNEQAGFAARRALAEQPDGAVGRLFELVWARAADPGQLRRARDFLERPGVELSDLAVVLYNSSPFLYVD